MPVSLNGAGARSSIQQELEQPPWTLQPGEAKRVTIPAPASFKAWNYGEPGRAAAGIHGVAQLGNGKSATSNSLKMLPP